MSAESLTVGNEIEESLRQIDRHRETNWESLDNPEMRAFAAKFVFNPIPSKAAVEAGLSPSAGARLLEDPVCRAYITYLQELVAGQSIINTTYLDNLLAKLIPIFLGEEEAPVALPGGFIESVKKLHGSELMRAIDMIAKHNGYYNADLSQNSVLQMMQAMQEIGRKHSAEESPVDPRSFRVIEGEKE